MKNNQQATNGHNCTTTTTPALANQHRLYNIFSKPNLLQPNINLLQRDYYTLPLSICIN